MSRLPSDAPTSNQCDALTALKYDTCECTEKCEPCRGVREKAIAEIERLQQRVAELDGKDGWRANAEYLLGRCSHTIRVCDSEHPNDLLTSFVVTFVKMEDLLKERTAEPPTAVVYTPCAQHMGLSWRMHIPYQPPPRLVCPICELPDGVTATKSASAPK